jgi:hypothetical protein
MSETKITPKNDELIAEMKVLGKEIESSSNFLKVISTNDKKLYLNMVKRIQTDTNNELTSTEYEGIAKMMFFCDRFEQYLSGINIQDADPDLLDLYRKMKTQVTFFLRDHREGKKVTPPSIQIIKNYLVKLENIDKELKEAKFIKNDEAIILDIEEVEKNG